MPKNSLCAGAVRGGKRELAMGHCRPSLIFFIILHKPEERERREGGRGDRKGRRGRMREEREGRERKEGTHKQGEEEVGGDRKEEGRGRGREPSI